MSDVKGASQRRKAARLKQHIAANPRESVTKSAVKSSMKDTRKS
jgi:hypothetical protein